MRIIMLFAVAVTTATLFSPTASHAQYLDGYGFAAGAFAGCGNGFGSSFCHHRFGGQPPYFALYPPVYYSGIVPRPYGISPFAAPAGISPVELNCPPPLTVKNPFYQDEVSPVSGPSPSSAIESSNDKTTSSHRPAIKTNPFVGELIVRD